MEELAIGEVAQRAGIRPSASGFTVAEIQTLLHGFAPDTPPAARWKPMAHQKIAELDALIVRAQRMKSILETGLDCGCLRLEDCAVALERGRCVE